MKAHRIAWGCWLLAVLGLAGSQVLAEIAEIPEKYMFSKGGVLYPHTGDSSQQMFQTPPTARQMFPPGTLIGVLPADCTSASHGSVGEYYRCDYDFAMKEETHADGRTVYRVIEAP